ncbi:MAG TPA: hypothetical protein VLM91_04845 [Candidatus Methylomirabilis sp.]|nr:hypothetical protein [Candidatus Methylomirabilis sp.]
MSGPKLPGSASAGHELSDLSPRAIAIFGIVLAATVIACLLLAAWIFNYLSAREARQDVPPSPLAKQEAPSEPLLQVSAPKDMAEMRAQEEKILTSYAWVNKQAGTVRIPIDRAMRLLAEREKAGQPAKAKSQ